MDAWRSQQPPGKWLYKENDRKARILVLLAIFTKSHLKAVDNKRPASSSQCSVGRITREMGVTGKHLPSPPVGSTELAGGASLPKCQQLMQLFSN